MSSSAYHSRAIPAVTPHILEAAREFVPTADDLDPEAHYIPDGTLLPCWSWDGHNELYSGKHSTIGINVKIGLHHLRKACLDFRPDQHPLQESLRAARYSTGGLFPGLAVMFPGVFHRWESSVKPLSPRHLAELSSIFPVRALMPSTLTRFGFFTGVRMQ